MKLKNYIPACFCALVFAVAAQAVTYEWTGHWVNSNSVEIPVVVKKLDAEGVVLSEFSFTVPASGSKDVFHSLDYSETEAQSYDVYGAETLGGISGNSYIASVGSEGGLVYHFSLLPALGGGTETYDVTGFLPSGGRLPTPDSAKTLWIVDDSTLTAGLFREGVDKIVYATAQGAAGGGGTTGGTEGGTMADVDEAVEDKWKYPPPNSGAAMTEASAAMEAAMAVHSTAVVTAITDETGTVSQPVVVAPGSASGFSFGTITLAAIGETIEMNVFERWPQIETYAAIFREIALALMMFLFAIRMRQNFESYFKLWMTTSNHTNRAGAEPVVGHAVGWGKQILTATVLVTSFIAVIGITIFAMNSQMAAILTGSGVGTATLAVSNAVGSAVGNEAFAKIYGLLGLFFPIAALVQLAVAAYFVEWTLPGTWAAALMLAKLFHI